jgi:hypothetical protein
MLDVLVFVMMLLQFSLHTGAPVGLSHSCILPCTEIICWLFVLQKSLQLDAIFLVEIWSFGIDLVCCLNVIRDRWARIYTT